MSSILTQETKPSYTASVPVLTPGLLQELSQNPATADQMRYVGLSKSAGIFADHARSCSPLGVSFWETTIPAPVQAFVTTGLEMLGAAKMQALIPPYLRLKGNGLADKAGNPVTAVSIARSYWDSGITRELACAFGAYFVRSTCGVLGNLPKGSSLEANYNRYVHHYSSAPETFLSGHMDDTHVLLLNMQSPGAPYLGADYAVPLFRATSGHLVLHGGDVVHGFATAERLADAQPRPRFLPQYVVWPGMAYYK